MSSVHDDIELSSERTERKGYTGITGPDSLLKHQ